MKKPTTRNRKKPGESIWVLADLFRTDKPADWIPESIEFQRQLGIVRAAGFRWDMHFSIGTDGGQFQARIFIHQETTGSARGLPARRRSQLFRFVERMERKLWRLRYDGSLIIDRLDGRCSGYFNKYVNDAAAVRREIRKLTSFKII